jgi:endonuclease III related protein
MLNLKDTKILLKIYDRLFKAYGPQHWWPGDSPFEVIIGAILTQSTAWTNVSKAIDNLKSFSMLSPAGIRKLPEDELAQLIRPSGYYHAKAKKLKAFIDFLDEKYNDNLDAMFSVPAALLRAQLLSVHGIGPETADSILLYAAVKPVFVIDAYTRRVFTRLGMLPGGADYAACQKYFMNNLPPDERLFNEYHALLVNLGKLACRKTPVCERCPLKERCRYNFEALNSGLKSQRPDSKF